MPQFFQDTRMFIKIPLLPLSVILKLYRFVYLTPLVFFFKEFEIYWTCMFCFILKTLGKYVALLMNLLQYHDQHLILMFLSTHKKDIHLRWDTGTSSGQ